MPGWRGAGLASLARTLQHGASGRWLLLSEGALVCVHELAPCCGTLGTWAMGLGIGDGAPGVYSADGRVDGSGPGEATARGRGPGTRDWLCHRLPF